jgi:hypothetical protein
MSIKPLPDFVQGSMVTRLIRHDFSRQGRPQVLCVGNFFPYRVEWGTSDSFYGGLIELKDGEWISVTNSSLPFDGDIREAQLLTSINKEKILLVSRNNSQAGFV